MSVGGLADVVGVVAFAVVLASFALNWLAWDMGSGRRAERMKRRFGRSRRGGKGLHRAGRPGTGLPYCACRGRLSRCAYHSGVRLWRAEP